MIFDDLDHLGYFECEHQCVVHAEHCVLEGLGLLKVADDDTLGACEVATDSPSV